MQTTSTERGMALVILIVIIVMMGILSAGVISIMEGAQRSYPVHARSYQALNLANAGAEFAMRYANDNGSWKTALANPTTVTYGSGTFTIHYLNDANKNLQSVGQSATAQREVRISTFDNYALGFVSIVLRSTPTRSGTTLTIPINNVGNVDGYVKYMTITLKPPGTTVSWLNHVDLNGATPYNASADRGNTNVSRRSGAYYNCIPVPSPYASGCTYRPTEVPDNVTTMNMKILTGSTTQNLVLTMQNNAKAGDYTIIFYHDLDTVYDTLLTSTITFTVL